MRLFRRLSITAGVLLGLVVLTAYGWRRYMSVDSVVPTTSTAQTAAPIHFDPTDWPFWRGPHGDGTSPSTVLPTEWSATDNVVWKVDVPGRGHGSPCVFGKQVIVATADEEKQIISLRSYDRDSGSNNWEVVIHQGGFMAKHEKNSFASPTPGCDGTYVFYPAAIHGAIVVTAVTLDGKIAWQTEAGPYVSEWGYGSSLALHGNLVFVAADNRGSKLGRLRETSYLAAMNRADGTLVWRIKRPNERSYGTPIVAKVAGRDQLLLSGPGLIASYDPATGAELWRCRTGAERVAGTMAFDKDHVYASAFTGKKEIVCIKADGSGDVTDTHVVWRESRGAADVPSPLLYEGQLYLVDDSGIAQSLDPTTGQSIWRSRLRGKFSASPVAGAGHIFVSNEDGVTYVIKPGKTLEVVAKNESGDSLFASPALSADRIFLRSSHSLFCIGISKGAEQAVGISDRNLSIEE